jgi:hypothetical protein
MIFDDLFIIILKANRAAFDGVPATRFFDLDFVVFFLHED